MRTREVRGIGRLEGPGSERRSGLPPRILFLPRSPTQMGPESAQALKSYYVPTLLVLWGRNWVAGPPFSAVFKVQRRFPRNLLCSGYFPPGTFGVFSDRLPRRVPRPLFPGDAGVAKSGDLATDRGEEENGSRVKKMTEERGKMTDGESRKWAEKKTVTYDRCQDRWRGDPRGAGNLAD